MAVSDTKRLCDRIGRYMAANGLTLADFAVLASVPLPTLEKWQGGMKAVGTHKAAALALMDGPHPADGLITAAVTVRHTSYKLDHAGLCRLLGLPETAELEVFECDKRKLALPFSIRAQVQEGEST